jgi:hypothetical protein
MDSTKLYRQSGTGVSGLDSLTCSVSRVDLCHQATDHEEEEEDEENCEQISVHSHTSKPSSHHHTWCIPLRRIRGRQRLVILMVMGMCLLTAAFTGLIWYGMGDNNIDSVTMAKVFLQLSCFLFVL